MPDFEAYVASIEDRASAALVSAPEGSVLYGSDDLLDGQVSHKLREAIPLGVRRERGAFFTSSDLRSAALVAWPGTDGPSGPVLDPAVGAGDLLIEVAQSLPVFTGLDATLDFWGAQLHGRDIEPSFVRLAKARLALLAISRGAMPSAGPPLRLDDLFPGIAVGDGLDVLNDGWENGHILMNPPFGYHSPELAVEWAKGRTNMAASFLASAVEHSTAGTCLTAILPEVIRTGSRYGRLRAFVSERLRVIGVEPFGRFDSWTDVDVFTLRGVVTEATVEEASGSVEWWQRSNGRRLGELFDVSVGSVVPHRDEESGEDHPYLQARQIPLGGEYDASEAEQRRFVSRLFEPPFVVVRRTSRPADRARGVGTLIEGSVGVLVENHLLVCKPKDGSIDSCRRAVAVLRSPESRAWLDQRIRCRHLTVGALREMPWLDR